MSLCKIFADHMCLFIVSFWFHSCLRVESPCFKRVCLWSIQRGSKNACEISDIRFPGVTGTSCKHSNQWRCRYIWKHQNKVPSALKTCIYSKTFLAVDEIYPLSIKIQFFCLRQLLCGWNSCASPACLLVVLNYWFRTLKRHSHLQKWKLRTATYLICITHRVLYTAVQNLINYCCTLVEAGM